MPVKVLSLRPLLAACCAQVLLLLAAAPGLQADILVMKDGTRVETEGAWKAQGRQLVFTVKGGQLSAVRADEVDIVASEKATRDALTPPPAPPSADQIKAAQKALKPVMVLTDKDIPRAADETLPESLADAASLEVVDGRFEPFPGDPAFRITGTVINNANSIVRDARIVATLTGETGGERRTVTCEAPIEIALDPAQREDFSCDIPRADIDGTGLPQAFLSAVVSFEARVGFALPPPPPELPEGQG